jgi:hypothetical protein
VLGAETYQRAIPGTIDNKKQRKMSDCSSRHSKAKEIGSCYEKREESEIK